MKLNPSCPLPSEGMVFPPSLELWVPEGLYPPSWRVRPSGPEPGSLVADAAGRGGVRLGSDAGLGKSTEATPLILVRDICPTILGNSEAGSERAEGQRGKSQLHPGPSWPGPLPNVP